MKLYTYWRSSASYRVRIALNLKGLTWTSECVHLLKDGGQHLSGEHTARNPQNLVPVLELDDGTLLTQSLAIMDYLDEMHPEPAFLPAGSPARARQRAIAQAAAIDIHPLNNLRVLNYLSDPLGRDKDTRDTWYRHWVRLGFEGIERLLARCPERAAFCGGAAPGYADICLVPQVYNARRFGVDLAAFPLIEGIERACLALPAFAGAVPERQPDAPPAR